MDWKHPDYGPIFDARVKRLQYLREDPTRFERLKTYYRDGHVADFINDWGVTFDPRNADVGLPTLIPFILFPKQREWIDFVIRKWRERRRGLVEKSRDMGVTWLAVGTAAAICSLYDGVTIGFGSRKSEYVDKIGQPKAILPKVRTFMENLPEELCAGHVPWRDAPYMRISFPNTGSLISGEGGDDIGRGDRASIYFFDEAAHHPHQELVEAALSQTTNCRIDLSSVRGMNNQFAKNRWGGKIEVFIFDWRDDPRKDPEWYAKMQEELDPVVLAQEVDRDYSASVRGVVIPAAWVRSAIGAHEKLGIAPAGVKTVTYDVADEGQDKNAVCIGRGVSVEETDEWSGKDSDTFASTEYVFDVCDEQGVAEFTYDGDGIGAGVRGDARVINERRKANRQRQVSAVMYRGSGAVHDPEGTVEGTIGSNGEDGRTNEDYFHNFKAQCWWGLRKRFERTHRWIEKGIACDPDTIVNLNKNNPNLMKLVAELSQATFKQSETGKLLIEKTPKGMKSPNMGDTVVMKFAPKEASFEVTSELLATVAKIAARGRRR